MSKKEKYVKVRYSQEEFKIVKEKAEKLGKTPNQYQREISKKAKVKIE